MMIRSLFLFLALVSCFLASYSQKTKSTESPQIQRKDLEYIKCEVCEHAAEEISKHVKEGRKKGVNNNIDEVQLAEIMESVCKPTNHTAGKVSC